MTAKVETSSSGTKRTAVGPVTVIPRDDKSVASAVNTLAWPIILENLFQTLLGTTDMIMVARLGDSAVAGVGAAMQLLMVMQAAVAAITTGTIVLVARSIGAGDPETAGRVTKQSVSMGIVVSAVVALMGVFFSEWAVRALGTEPDVAVLGGSYLRVVTAASVVMVLMFVLNAALRGSGDTQTPMKVTGFINLVNIGVAYVLIFGHLGFPALGVVGSAWGATVARTVGCLILLTVFLRGRGRVSLRGRDGWRPDPKLMSRLWRLGLPSMVEQFLLSAGALAYSTIAISLGTMVYAAQRITFQIISLSFMPGMGFALAATTMVGQCLGAGRPAAAERCSWYAVRTALLLMAVAGGAMALFGRHIMTLFTSEPELIAIGAQALVVIAISQPFQAIGQVLAGSLRGAGDTRFPMVATFSGIWLIRLPLGFLFGVVLGWGLPGIYISNILDAAGRATANYLRYRSGRWRSIAV